MSAPSPGDDAVQVLHRTLDLLIASRTTRERLMAMTPTDAGDEAERALFLAMLTRLEPGLIQGLKAVLGELKGHALASEAEQWFRMLERDSG